MRSLIAFAIHEFFNSRGFVYVHTPLITGSDCEGAGEMFRVTTLDMENLPKDDQGKIDYSKDVSKVSIVGAGMVNNAGVATTMFEALYNANININMIATSEIKISVLFEQKDAERAVVAIHDKFLHN